MIRRPHAIDDSGAILVQVLAIVLVCSVGLTALLSYVETSLRTTVNLRDQAAATYTADGAIHAAVNTIRASGYTGAAGQSCFGGSNTLSLPNFSGSDSASVACSTDPNRVIIQCPALTNCNRPGNAILTLGGTGEEGVHIDQPNGGSTFKVRGVVYSNSSINVSSGSLSTDSAVYAKGTCSGTITAPSKQCPFTGSYPLSGDPGYALEQSTMPVYRDLPACTTANSVVTFLPGYYDDAVGLSAMMAGNSACKHSTWWFKPGSYYFDFHNSTSAAVPSGTDVWTVDDGSLIAGTPVSASGAALAAPPVNPTIPGSCDNPISNPLATGVQFVFGGDSRFAIKSGKAEICGTYHLDRPPVAVYGVPSGSASVTTLAGATALEPTAVTAGSPFTGATAATLNTTDGTAASWTSANKNDTASLTVTGFTLPGAIPPGSTLTAASVKVTHRHSKAGNDSVQATLTPTLSSGTAASLAAGTAAAAGGATAAFTTSTLAISASTASSLASAVHAGSLTGASIRLDVSGSAGSDRVDIDSVQLELTYEVPSYRAASGCVTDTPYTGAGAAGSPCSMITSINNNGNAFYVQGTTYAPTAAVDITLNNAAEQVFRFGVVVRTLRVKLTGSFSFTGPVIEVPADSPGFAISVYLTAYVCPGSNPCPASGTPAVRSRVAFLDGSGHRQVMVLSWSRST